MKGYLRRALGKPDFWKLAIWDAAIQCWRDGKRQFDNREEAKQAAGRPGRYRLSFVQDGKGRRDEEDFVV